MTDRLVTVGVEIRSFLFMNRGDGTFEPEPTTFSGLDSVGLSAVAVDLDNDGLTDLVVAADRRLDLDLAKGLVKEVELKASPPNAVGAGS